MASVAVCPHCFVQLSVPDGTARDAHVACPTCRREFDLTLTVIRPLPEVVMFERATEENYANVNEEREAEDTIAAFAATAREVGREAEMEGVLADDMGGELPLISGDEAKTQVENSPERAEIEPPAEDSVATPARPATLAELMAARDAAETVEIAAAMGPSFDLPNVPLVRASGATVEFDSISQFGDVGGTNTEFELDDVDFDAHPAEMAQAADESEFAAPDAVESTNFHPHRVGEEFANAAIIPTPQKRRRKRSAVRMLAGTVLGGLFGLAIGYYLLLVLAGPRGDFLEVAQYLPQRVVPSSFTGPGPRSARELPARTHTSPTGELTAPPEVPAVAVTPEEPAAEVAATEEPQASENIPAAYEETAPPNEGESTVDELLATDPGPSSPPAEFSEAPAEPLPTTPIEETPPPLPLTGPSYTASEFETLLATAELAEAGLIEGDLSDAAVRRTKGLSYAKLCDLAHAMVFAKIAPNNKNGAELQSHADKVFANTLATTHARDEVARIAAIWVSSPHRRHGGVFLAGTVSGGQIAGDVYEYGLAAPDGGKYTVLASLPLDAAADSADAAVAIVGTIVDHPATNVAGYAGTAQRAIFATRALPLP